MNRKVILAFVALMSAAAMACAQPDGEATAKDEEQVGIEERLGDYVPLHLGFLDSSADSVYLRDVINKPTILTLVYYHCPTICKPLLSGVADVVEKTDLEPGKDYDMLTVSFDELDNPQTAKQMKSNFTASLRGSSETSWRFMTADSATIALLTRSVGFYTKRQEKDFAHGTALIVLSPEGKIIRYLYGLDYLPFDLKMAVAEATKGVAVPSVPRVLRFCFSYDPEGRRYVFNFMRVMGTGILMFALGWVVYITRFGRNRREKRWPTA